MKRQEPSNAMTTNPHTPAHSHKENKTAIETSKFTPALPTAQPPRNHQPNFLENQEQRDIELFIVFFISDMVFISSALTLFGSGALLSVSSIFSISFSVTDIT
uniref:Uncharacterized protein n=1 Tax=Glossina austeni TaxID=7395 RepID=A0A1A9V0T9_GLOAU